MGQGWGAGVAAALLLAAPAGAAPAAPASAQAARETPSGQPVPRYVATKFAAVNARGGPGDDFRLLWTYRARGLPLQVIAETSDWRRVCDPDGSVAWVHRRTVAETRSVLRTAARPLPIRSRPSVAAPAPAILAGRSIAALKGCDKGWCRISVDKAQGWVRQGEVWGTDEAPQCRVAADPGTPPARR